MTPNYSDTTNKPTMAVTQRKRGTMDNATLTYIHSESMKIFIKQHSSELSTNQHNQFCLAYACVFQRPHAVKSFLKKP